MKDVVLGLARHLLGALGAAAATKGLIEASQVDGIVGALLLLLGVGLSVADKLKKK